MDMVIIHRSNKGLRTYVSYRPTFVKLALKEHLSNPANYIRLDPSEADGQLAKQQKLFMNLFHKNRNFLEEHYKYFERSLNGTIKRHPLFYRLWKIH